MDRRRRGWPTADREVAVHAAAAAVLGLRTGMTVTLGASPDEARPGSTLMVVGTWLPADTAAPFWFTEELEVAGEVGTRLGPFVTTEATATTTGVRPQVRWRVDPDLDRLTVAVALVWAFSVVALSLMLG